MKHFLLTLLLSGQLVAQSNIQIPPGKMVEMGGYKMHYLETGESKNGPTVIFFHGAGDIALHWNLVLPLVAEFAHSIAIDQNGEGWSEHGHGNSLKQQVYDSHQMLKEAGISGPYIVVGHSLGGILAHQFAVQYKRETAGLIFVDATHPDVVLKIFNRESETMEWKQMRLNAKREVPEVSTGSINSEREIASFKAQRDFGDQLEKFSQEDQQRFNWIYNERPWTYIKGQSSTYEAEIFQEMYEHYDQYDLGDLPLVVITGVKKKKPEGDENWSGKALRHHSRQLQKDFLKLSTNSQQIIAKKSGHSIHIDQPELIASVIKDMLMELARN
ncbi:alpha/beta hydrolase [Roseivirga sp.]|uniref:alpha/beta hydrolase n=1 Tax=Roseivirga sp. TaxID=1964215 RepID=UPI003B51DF62